MKNRIIVAGLAVLITLMGGISSCKKSTFDINRNPNQPTDSTITYNLLLASAYQNSAYYVNTQWGFIQNWMGYWARSGTYAPNVAEETYDVNANFQTGVWDNAYSNNFNYNIMQQKAKQAGATFYEGVARIMKAHNFGILVDFYNNIPYKQALLGNQNITPSYDNGLDVYKDLFRQIDTGIALIKATNPDLNIDYENNDLMYGGDPVLWAKFGNSLKLRFIIHLYQTPGFNVAPEIDSINKEGSGFLGAGETADINPGFNDSKPSPYSRLFNLDEDGAVPANNQYFRANSYAIGYYSFHGDFRINRFYTAPSGGHRGVEYGLPPIGTNVAARLSAVTGPGLLPDGAETNAWIFTSVESLFLQAEATERGFLNIGLSAKELWDSAVTESFVFLDPEFGRLDAEEYIADNEGSGVPDVDFEADPIYAILSQKWFALNTLAPFEVYTDYRRTDIVYGEAAGYDPGPPISVAPQNTKTTIPKRLFYPQSEYNYNAANVGGQGSIDPQTSKIFWDIN